MIYVAIGIIGATVMPHNLYLHSALVQTPQAQQTTSRRSAARSGSTRIDSIVALTIAFLVNAAILVLAAMVFYGRESVSPSPAARSSRSATTATGFASPTSRSRRCWARPLASISVRRRAAGQRPEQHDHRHAGRPGRDGRLHALADRAWVRRLITRGLAILPAVFIIGVRGEGSVNDLLTLSQVVLALQLPLRHVPAAPLHQLEARWASWKSGWFLLDGRLGQRDPDHRDGCLRPARVAEGAPGRS